MKTKITTISLLLLFIVFSSCKQEEQVAAVEEVKVDLLNDEFPEAKKAILKTIDSIGVAIRANDLDKLISFHAYGPKFTEFKNGEPRNDGAENERFERATFGAVTEIVRFDMNDLKVDVYGDVANVTLHSDFHLKFGEDLAVVNEQMSLLFLNTKDGWRIVHEHHSPLAMNTPE